MKIPEHLAIIMDGNGRWAKARGRERTFGHLEGAGVAKTVIERCADLGVKHLTLYAFSTENWFRPKTEVHFLMKLLSRYLRAERQNLITKNIRFTAIGDLARVPEFVAEQVRITENATAHCTGLHLLFALSYGSRQEITNVMQKLAVEVAAGRLDPEQIDESMINSNLETAGIADPDLIIRTSGEFRLSNFLLWQAAYSELYITDKLWPDFNVMELERAFAEYGKRERRFGGTQVLESSLNISKRAIN